MVEAELVEIRINEVDHEQIILLAEREGDRHLPIVIGLCEANAIHIRAIGIQPPRPLTHDLLNNTILELGGEIDRIVISDLVDGTFYAQIIVDMGDEERMIDARPSDAIALAVRAGCAIFIEDHVLDRNQEEAF